MNGTSDRSGTVVFLAVLLGLTGLHVVLAMTVPVSGDEAYYWDCSRHVDWSYFDQPPLVIWSMVPFRALLGECRLAVRAPAVLASLPTPEAARGGPQRSQAQLGPSSSANPASAPHPARPAARRMDEP